MDMFWRSSGNCSTKQEQGEGQLTKMDVMNTSHGYDFEHIVCDLDKWTNMKYVVCGQHYTTVNTIIQPPEHKKEH